MLGNAMLRILSEDRTNFVEGTIRNEAYLRRLPPELQKNIIVGTDLENPDQMTAVFAKTKPEVVINCVGLVKQHADSNDPLMAISVNSLLPHRLSRFCAIANARLIHFSTDCVFSGKKGSYVENDPCDAKDLYGQTKFLGEVEDHHVFTIRTSIIGHELVGTQSLIGWFLAQSGSVKGYTRAIFSGLPTVELARVVRDFILVRPNLSGVWHIGAEPISKFDLLKLVAGAYGKEIEIIPDADLKIDRSLDSSRFRQETGYAPPPWAELVDRMHNIG